MFFGNFTQVFISFDGDLGGPKFRCSEIDQYWTNERRIMRVNYKGNKMRKEAARRQEQEAKRLRRLNRANDNNPQTAPAEGTPPVEGTDPSGT